MTESKSEYSLEGQLVELSRMAEGLSARMLAATAPERSIAENIRMMGKRLRALQEQAREAEAEKRNLSAMVEIGQVINSSLELHTVLNEVVDTIVRLTGAERCFLMLRDERGTLQILAARNWEQVSLESSESEISDTIVQKVVDSGKAILTTNALTDPRFGGQSSIIAYNLRSILCVPLKLKDTLTGVIYADNRIREGIFTERERDLLSAFANQAAIALENARLFESVSRTLDEVTELKNLMEDVFASIDNAVITAGTDGTITLCNKASETILGSPRDSILGASLPALLATLSPDMPGYFFFGEGTGCALHRYGGSSHPGDARLG